MTAVAVGAKVIEKHFNLSNNKSIDSFFSTSDKDFKNMITNIRITESALGSGKIEISKSGMKNYNSRRSIYVSSDIKIGDKISDKNIKIVRPNYGLHPKYYNYLLNKKSKVNLKIGDRFKLEYVKIK